MSELSTVARPYAKAVFELAKESAAIGPWSDNLQLLASVVENVGVSKLLINPSLTREKKAEMLIAICKDKISVEAENLVKLMAENNRLAAFSEVQTIFEQLKSEDEGTIDAQLISAFEISDAQKKEVQSSLEKRFGQDVNLEVSIDESLIGGAIIKAGDLVIDGSINARLQRLSSQMSR